eukprot:1196037-Prorocentrum_minimum.AAC.2
METLLIHQNLQADGRLQKILDALKGAGVVRANRALVDTSSEGPAPPPALSLPPSRASPSVTVRPSGRPRLATRPASIVPASIDPRVPALRRRSSSAGPAPPPRWVSPRARPPRSSTAPSPARWR